MINKVTGKVKKENDIFFLSKIEIKGDGFEESFEDYNRKEFDDENLIKLFIKEYLVSNINIPESIILNSSEPEIIYE